MAFLRVRENSDALCRIPQLRMYRQAQPNAWAHSVGFRILSVFTNTLITVWLAYSPILLITCFDMIDTSTPHVALVGCSSGSSQNAVLKRHYNALLCTVGHPARNRGPPRPSATMQTSFRTRSSANHLFFAVLWPFSPFFFVIQLLLASQPLLATFTFIFIRRSSAINYMSERFLDIIHETWYSYLLITLIGDRSYWTFW